MPAAKNSQSGFSMIELLVAVTILAVGLLGLAQLQVTAIKANSQSASSTAATALAQRVIEEVTAMDAADPMFDAAGGGTWPGLSVPTLAGAGDYNITFTVAPVLANPGVASSAVSNLFVVTITVASTTDLLHVGSNTGRSVTMSTLKRAI